MEENETEAKKKSIAYFDFFYPVVKVLAKSRENGDFRVSFHLLLYLAKGERNLTYFFTKKNEIGEQSFANVPQKTPTPVAKKKNNDEKMENIIMKTESSTKQT